LPFSVKDWPAGGTGGTGGLAGGVMPDFCGTIKVHMDAVGDLKVSRSAMKITRLEGPSDDREYWHSRSAYERLQAVETLRQINYGNGPSTNRLQRILEIAQRT